MDTITTEIIELAPLLQYAVDTLTNAKTSAEILDARNAAHTAFAAAQEAEHRARVTGAAQAIISACHEAQAQALKIESQAKIRLADEYDAAQKRGEVSRQGNSTPRQGRTAARNITDQNVSSPTLADIGLTGKDVHEARKLRNAEANEPGIISKTIDAQVASGQAPKRSTMAKAVNSAVNKSQPQPQPKPNKSYRDLPKVDKVRAFIQDDIIAVRPISREKLAEKLDVPERVVRDADIAERYYQKGRNDALEELAAGKIESLSLTAQRKLEVHDRVLSEEHKRRIAQRIASFDEEVRVRVVEQSKDYVAMLQEREKKANSTETFYRTLINNNKPLFSETEFTAILRCLHSDSRNSLSDERLNIAFNLLNSKKLQLTGQKP